MAKKKVDQYQVFISHSTKDKWIAQQLDQLLQTRGVATFRDDRDIEGGAKIPEEIREQLHRSKELLVLWTPQAIESKWVSMEVAMAFGLNLHLVAIRYLTTVESLPPCMLNLQAPELTERDVKKYVEDAAARARQYRGG